MMLSTSSVVVLMPAFFSYFIMNYIELEQSTPTLPISKYLAMLQPKPFTLVCNNH